MNPWTWHCRLAASAQALVLATAAGIAATDTLDPTYAAIILTAGAAHLLLAASLIK